MGGVWIPDVFSVEHPRQVWLITIAHGVNEFYTVALPPILPLIVADFDITYGQAGALITTFFVMYSVFQLPVGFIADRIGKRRLLAGGMVLLSGGLFIVGMATDFSLLLVGQAIAGIGGSTYHPTGMSLISDLEATTTEGRAMGIHGFGGVAGMALSPVLIGGLASVFDWRLALSVGAAVGVIYAVIFLLLFSTPTAIRPARNGGGSSESEAGLRARLRSIVAIPIAGWVIALFAVNFLVSFEIGSIRTFAPTYLFVRLGDSTSIANGIYFVMLTGAGIASIGAGNLADRFDRITAGVLIFGLSALVIGGTVLIPPRPSAMLGWFFVLGIVTYSVSPMKNAITSSYSERGFSGSLFGLMVSASSIGGALGPLVLGASADRFGWGLTFPAIGLISLVGILAFLVLRRE